MSYSGERLQSTEILDNRVWYDAEKPREKRNLQTLHQMYVRTKCFY